MALFCCGKNVDRVLTDKQVSQLTNLNEAGMTRCPPPRLRAREEAVPVTINVYSLIEKNATLAKIGLGVFHTGVVVYGIEWSYGEAPDNPDGSGLFSVHPGQAAGSLYKTIRLGHTTRSPAQVDTILHRLENEWRSADYHILHHNCNNFSQAFCNLLSTTEKLEIPRWCNRVARAGDRVVPRKLATKIHRRYDVEPPKARRPQPKTNVSEIPVSVIPRGWYLHPSIAQPPRYCHVSADSDGDEEHANEKGRRTGDRSAGSDRGTSGAPTRTATLSSSPYNALSPAPGFTAEEMASMEVQLSANLPALVTTEGQARSGLVNPHGWREHQSVLTGSAGSRGPVPIHDEGQMGTDEPAAGGTTGGGGQSRRNDSYTSVTAAGASFSTVAQHANSFSQPWMAGAESPEAGPLLPLSSFEFKAPSETGSEQTPLSQKRGKERISLRSKMRKVSAKTEEAAAASSLHKRTGSGAALRTSQEALGATSSQASLLAGAVGVERSSPQHGQGAAQQQGRTAAAGHLSEAPPVCVSPTMAGTTAPSTEAPGASPTLDVTALEGEQRPVLPLREDPRVADAGREAGGPSQAPLAVDGGDVVHGEREEGCLSGLVLALDGAALTDVTPERYGRATAHTGTPTSGTRARATDTLAGLASCISPGVLSGVDDDGAPARGPLAAGEESAETRPLTAAPCSAEDEGDELRRDSNGASDEREPLSPALTAAAAATTAALGNDESTIGPDGSRPQTPLESTPVEAATAVSPPTSTMPVLPMPSPPVAVLTGSPRAMDLDGVVSDSPRHSPPASSEVLSPPAHASTDARSPERVRGSPMPPPQHVTGARSPSALSGGQTPAEASPLEEGCHVPSLSAPPPPQRLEATPDRHQDPSRVGSEPASPVALGRVDGAVAHRHGLISPSAGAPSGAMDDR